MEIYGLTYRRNTSKIWEVTTDMGSVGRLAILERKHVYELKRNCCVKR